MAGFLYFFPNKRFAAAGDVPMVGDLPSIFRDASVHTREIEGRGPGGESGTIVAIEPAAGGTCPRVGYWENLQTWTQVTNAAGELQYWIGWETASRPGPADLRRCRAPEGHLVELGDGNAWLIPCVAAATPQQLTLPTAMELDAAGELVFRVTPGYEDLVLEAKYWWDVASNPGSTYSIKRYWSYAASLLGVCYRLGRAEVNALSLLLNDGRQMKEVIYSSLGAPDVDQQDEQKKTEVDRPPDT
jgi:hypothetical protein